MKPSRESKHYSGGSRNFQWRFPKKVGRKVVGPCPLQVNSFSLFERFVDLVTLFALCCEADGNVIHITSHLVAGNEITS